LHLFFFARDLRPSVGTISIVTKANALVYTFFGHDVSVGWPRSQHNMCDAFLSQACSCTYRQPLYLLQIRVSLTQRLEQQPNHRSSGGSLCPHPSYRANVSTLQRDKAHRRAHAHKQAITPSKLLLAAILNSQPTDFLSCFHYCAWLLLLRAFFLFLRKNSMRERWIILH